MIKYQKIKTKRFEVDCGFDPRRKFIQNEELEMEMEFDENFLNSVLIVNGHCTMTL